MAVLEIFKRLCMLMFKTKCLLRSRKTFYLSTFQPHFYHSFNPLSMKPSTFLELDTSKRKVKIKKLTDNEFSNLARNKFAAIFEDYFFLMLLDRLYSKYKFTLAKIYTALYGLYGLHNGYDDYKGSFAYCFRLTIQADERTFTYLLHLRDIKGNPPYFTFYRELGKAEADKKGTYVQPIEADFSKEAMQEFMASFVGYLIGYFGAIARFLTPIRSTDLKMELFFKIVTITKTTKRIAMRRKRTTKKIMAIRIIGRLCKLIKTIAK
jgi:hypothetical protein